MKTKKLATISGDPPDWDMLWQKANLPEEDRSEWRRVMAPMTRSPESAERLARHGWTPANVEAARYEPLIYWPEDVRQYATGISMERWAALTVLADSVADYHAYQADLAREIRTDYFIALNEAGWEYSRIGELIGVSRQRIQRILHDHQHLPLILRRKKDRDG